MEAQEKKKTGMEEGIKEESQGSLRNKEGQE